MLQPFPLGLLSIQSIIILPYSKVDDPLVKLWVKLPLLIISKDCLLFYILLLLTDGTILSMLIVSTFKLTHQLSIKVPPFSNLYCFSRCLYDLRPRIPNWTPNWYIRWCTKGMMCSPCLLYLMVFNNISRMIWVSIPWT